MQRYEETLRVLLPESCETAEEACVAWEEEAGFRLAETVQMYTRESGQWTRWTMQRTGAESPFAQWSVVRCEPGTPPPAPRCPNCEHCGN